MFYRRIFSILLLSVVFLFTACGGENEVKPNILLITIDTLRSDHLGVYGYPRETSPFIDHLAKKGVRFKHAIVPIPLTAGGHASILTSLHPLTHNVIMNGTHLQEKVQTIAEVLKKNNYYTIGTIAIELLSGKRKFSQGFDSFSDKWNKEVHLNTKFPLFERTAQSVNKSLFKQIDEYSSNPNYNDKPLFIWVHYFDPHGPYYDHESITFKNKLPKGKPRGINRYDKEIRYTDDSIKELYRYLEQKGLTRKMITCITADHGEQFGEHGYIYGHADFYSENTFVPLIFHGYGIPKNKVVETYASTMDISTTLLGRIGLKFDHPTEGIDLLKKGSKPGHIKDRKFLIIGNPVYARSLQLLGYPFAYILNFDYHYKYWYISDQNNLNIPGNRFKPIPDRQIIKKGKKQVIRLPAVQEKGLYYAVLRLNIKGDKGLAVKIHAAPLLYTGRVPIPGKMPHLDIIYPVTIQDRLKVHLGLKEGTTIDNLTCALISAKEFNKNSEFKKKIENKIYKNLLTLRKKRKKDEFFDLSNDIKMEKNLVKVKKFKPTILESRKLIYSAYKYYLRKKSWLLKGVKEQEKLTAKDKEMLKSLGYL